MRQFAWKYCLTILEQRCHNVGAEHLKKGFGLAIAISLSLQIGRKRSEPVFDQIKGDSADAVPTSR